MRKNVGCCYICGVFCKSNHNHHILPKAKGGSHKKFNRLWLCEEHHYDLHHKFNLDLEALKTSVLFSSLFPDKEKKIFDEKYMQRYFTDLCLNKPPILSEIEKRLENTEKRIDSILAENERLLER